MQIFYRKCFERANRGENCKRECGERRGVRITRSENGTYQHDVVYLILIFNQNDKNVYF